MVVRGQQPQRVNMAAASSGRRADGANRRIDLK
jgi:hypothetical protein